MFPSLKTKLAIQIPSTVFWVLLTLHQWQMSVERRIKQLDFNMPHPFVLRGEKPQQRGVWHLLTPLSPFRTHAQLTEQAAILSVWPA